VRAQLPFMGTRHSRRRGLCIVADLVTRRDASGSRDARRAASTALPLRRKRAGLRDAAPDPAFELAFCSHALGVDAYRPSIGRPPITNGCACGSARNSSVSPGSTRTIRLPCPPAATDILPPTRNTRPPNMLSSLTSGSSAISSRMRLARSSSSAMPRSSGTHDGDASPPGALRRVTSGRLGYRRQMLAPDDTRAFASAPARPRASAVCEEAVAVSRLRMCGVPSRAPVGGSPRRRGRPGRARAPGRARRAARRRWGD
jgi:hypothetical protein